MDTLCIFLLGVYSGTLSLKSVHRLLDRPRANDKLAPFFHVPPYTLDLPSSVFQRVHFTHARAVFNSVGYYLSSGRKGKMPILSIVTLWIFLNFHVIASIWVAKTILCGVFNTYAIQP